MSYRALLFVVSAVAGASGVAMLPAVITASIYQEWNDALLIGMGERYDVIIEPANASPLARES